MTHPLKRYGADDETLRLAARFPQWIPARILGQYEDLYSAHDGTEEVLVCLSGKARHQGLFPATGDFVLLEPTKSSLMEILPRKSCFSRTEAGSKKREQVLAANVDFVLICMALDGNYSPNRLERYVSAVWGSGASPIILLTKADLSPDPMACLHEAQSLAPGVEVLLLSMLDETLPPAFLSLLQRGKTYSLTGSSGVGKSSLLNRLLGCSLQAIAEVRRDGKGRHTTTGREIFLLPSGALLMDTPGMREFALFESDPSRSFEEIEALAAQCRFSDCRHEGEPGCAVQRAIRDGRLDKRRFLSYQKLLRESRCSTLSHKERETEKAESMFRQIGGMKNRKKYLRDTDKRNRDV